MAAFLNASLYSKTPQTPKGTEKRFVLAGIPWVNQ